MTMFDTQHPNAFFTAPQLTRTLFRELGYCGDSGALFIEKIGGGYLAFDGQTEQWMAREVMSDLLHSSSFASLPLSVEQVSLLGKGLMLSLLDQGVYVVRKPLAKSLLSYRAAVFSHQPVSLKSTRFSDVTTEQEDHYDFTMDA